MLRTRPDEGDYGAPDAEQEESLFGGKRFIPSGCRRFRRQRVC
jgi:hypothetical protein